MHYEKYLLSQSNQDNTGMNRNMNMNMPTGYPNINPMQQPGMVRPMGAMPNYPMQYPYFPQQFYARPNYMGYPGGNFPNPNEENKK